MSRRKTITENMLAACAADLARYTAVRLKDDVLRRVIESDATLRRNLTKYYGSVSTEDAKHGLDTYERDYLFDSFAREVLGLDGWPIIGADKALHEQFVNTIHAKAKEGVLEIIQ